MAEIADVRIHGTTQERPIDRFVMEAKHLTPLGKQVSYLKVRRLERKVHGDCRVELDTNEYSVPYQLVGKWVDLEVVAGELTARWKGKIVAEHDIPVGRFKLVQNPLHIEGLVRKTYNMSGPNELARPIGVYADAVGE
jgi:hypothetical protein